MAKLAELFELTTLSAALDFFVACTARPLLTTLRHFRVSWDCTQLLRQAESHIAGMVLAWLYYINPSLSYFNLNISSKHIACLTIVMN